MPKIARVIFTIALDKEFDYCIPAGFDAARGMRVEVDFRGKRRLGVILHCKKSSSYKNLKPVIRLLDSRPVFDSDHIKVAKELARVYPYPVAEFLFMMVPPYMRKLHRPARKKDNNNLNASEDPVLPEGLSKNIKGAAQSRVLDKPLFIQGFDVLSRYRFWREPVRKALERGSVLICTPQVLTLQPLKTLLEQDFKKQVYVLHSYQSPKENLNSWMNSRSRCIILGTRGAIFYYPSDLRLIVVEEESSPYYLQEEKPFYHLREVAQVVSSVKSTALVFSGYYPSLEIYKKILEGKITIESGGDKKNNFKIVDISRGVSRRLITPVLSEILRKNIQDQKQSVVLWNKQGFAKLVSCSGCGNIYSCQRCSVPLRYHRKENLAVCPYCHKGFILPEVCPECRSGYFKSTGYGIERIESTLKKIFPQASTTTLEKAGAGDRIIISTSRILNYLYKEVKFDDGLVLDADFLLSTPDYLSVFDTYIYLKKISFLFRRDCYVFTAKHGYYMYRYLNRPWPEFYENELRLRKKMRLPPFNCLIKLIFRAKKEKILLKQVQNILELLKNEFTDIYGPHKEYPFKLRDRYRYSLVIKASSEGDYAKPIRKVIDSFNLGSTRLAIRVS